MGYKRITIINYFKHLDGIWCKMDTKVVTKMTATFYEPWNQMMHIIKFAKQLDKQQAYLKTTGITILDKSTPQFYTKKMIDSKMFDKRDIIDWEDRTKNKKTWSTAPSYFQKIVASEESYTRVVGGPEKTARFESAARSDERNDNKIGGNKKMRLYLDSPSTAATANTEQIQEMRTVNKSKDEQVVPCSHHSQQRTYKLTILLSSSRR